jgi:excisionase family DNA binding protein
MGNYLVSVPEAADLLGVSRQRVGKFIYDGLINPLRVGRDYGLSYAELLFVASQLGKPLPLDVRSKSENSSRKG